MADYKIVNPSAGNVYFDTTGTATTVSTQPTVNTGRAKGLGSNQTLLNNSGHGVHVSAFGSKLVGGNHLGTVFWGSAVSITSVAAVGGYAKYTLNSHGRSVGDVINITDTNGIVQGTQRITAKDANTFTTTKPYTSGAGTMTYRLATGTLGYLSAGNYVIRRVSSTLAGQANTVLRSGSSDFGQRRSIHKLEHMRTRKVATAIRAGYWDEHSGTFTTAPSVSDDASTFGTDDAANPTLSVPGELVYHTSAIIPVQDEYATRTLG